ncbi:MAG TPA: hypothetical protein VK525_02535 [Candidatus Saccharimonadales bacterium]|nr:hypothetical protein [Candidatus Saccharimonadales bacterium]
MRCAALLITLALVELGNAAGGGKVLTEDPLTGLPLIPQTDSRLHLGNEPQKIPDMTICKSKVQTDFYPLFDIKTSATLAWYAGHLPLFRKVHGFGMNRSQDAFYKTDGTMIVGITGTPAPDGQDSEGYSVAYMHAEPGLSEKTIASLGAGKIVCQ